MKAITREILIHLLYVLLAQIVTNASLDPNSYQLANNVQKFMTYNSVTKSYFDGEIYVMSGGMVSKPERRRSVRDGSDVSSKFFCYLLLFQVCSLNLK